MKRKGKYGRSPWRNDEFYLAEGRRAKDDGNSSQALVYFAKAIQLNPKCVEAYVQRAALLRALNRRKRPQTDLEKVVALTKNRDQQRSACDEVLILSLRYDGPDRIRSKWWGFNRLEPLVIRTYGNHVGYFVRAIACIFDSQFSDAFLYLTQAAQVPRGFKEVFLVRSRLWRAMDQTAMATAEVTRSSGAAQLLSTELYSAIDGELAYFLQRHPPKPEALPLWALKGLEKSLPASPEEPGPAQVDLSHIADPAERQHQEDFRTQLRVTTEKLREALARGRAAKERESAAKEKWSEKEIWNAADSCRFKNGTINFSKLGKKLGVSYKTAQNQCRKHGIR